MSEDDVDLISDKTCVHIHYHYTRDNICLHTYEKHFPSTLILSEALGSEWSMFYHHLLDQI
jgi:hypothetical protein